MTETEGETLGNADAEVARRIKDGASLIADLVGHPHGAPCIEELVYMNPELSEAEIQERLEKLLEADLVDERTLDPNQREPGQPCVFYSITPAARERFDDIGLFPPNAWQRQYAAVRKTEHIEELEALPRPSDAHR